MDLDQIVEQYHVALHEFVKGSHEPLWAMYSRREDAFLCNPFVAFARSPQEIEEAMKTAASHWGGGEVDFENKVKYETAELAYMIEREQFKATLDGAERSGVLRVTSIFRPEEGVWKVVHRHADPAPSGQPAILQK
ncbi:MAG: YybH family protein [Acidimicrobiia bacterium]